MRPSTRADRPSDRTSELRIILAISSIGAGVIHAAVVPRHLEEEASSGSSSSSPQASRLHGQWRSSSARR
jgi:hypothetical protein